MAVVARKRARSVVYFVVTSFKGRKYWERTGTDKREADRLNQRRKAEVRRGEFKPDAGTDQQTVRAFAEKWLSARTVKAAETEEQLIRDYVLSDAEFAGLRMADVRRKHVVALHSRVVVAKPVSGRTPALSRKTISNIFGVLGTMFGDAELAEVVAINPVKLPRGTLKRKGEQRQPYELEPVRALFAGAKHPTRRVFAALALYTGMREGEVCGRRWRDYDPSSAPLGALTIKTQYHDEPLKTDEPRRVPVHAELGALLDWWHAEGWEIVYCRKPTPEDWIVPPPRTPGRCYTKSGGYQLWRQLLRETGVANLSLHSTRHTFVTLARRGGARPDVLERVTHNARGGMIDQYTHWDWEPLCEAVACLPSLDNRLTETREQHDSRLQRLDSNRGAHRKLAGESELAARAPSQASPSIRRAIAQDGAEVSAGQLLTPGAWALALTAAALGLGTP